MTDEELALCILALQHYEPMDTETRAKVKALIALLKRAERSTGGAYRR